MERRQSLHYQDPRFLSSSASLGSRPFRAFRPPLISGPGDQNGALRRLTELVDLVLAVRLYFMDME